MNSHDPQHLEDDLALANLFKSWAHTMKAPAIVRRNLLERAAENGRKSRNFLGLAHWMVAVSRESVSMYGPVHTDEVVGWMFGRTLSLSLHVNQFEFRHLV